MGCFLSCFQDDNLDNEKIKLMNENENENENEDNMYISPFSDAVDSIYRRRYRRYCHWD
tara:strand:+ start:243 stop:419 length:177 start_codon:yes stop_codon:yes gene_type:complete